MITGSGIWARFRDYAVAIIENEVTKPPARYLLTATLHKDTSINLALHTRYIPVFANAHGVERTVYLVEPISFRSDYTIHQFRSQYHRSESTIIREPSRYLRGNAASPRPGN